MVIIICMTIIIAYIRSLTMELFHRKKIPRHQLISFNNFVNNFSLNYFLITISLFLIRLTYRISNAYNRVPLLTYYQFQTSNNIVVEYYIQANTNVQRYICIERLIRLNTEQDYSANSLRINESLCSTIERIISMIYV